MTTEQIARVTTFLEVEPGVAFTVFTEETNLWWRRGPRFRGSHAADSVVRFEGGAGGRLIEEDGAGTFEIGRVLTWEPGARLCFEWRGRNFAPGELTQVDVRFEPSQGGTRVVLEHRGWEALRPDHPVRHGQDVPAFLAMMGMWWGGLATSLRSQATPRVE
ncbi:MULTISPECIES: SRPBCC domain-containing protein [Myxococcus]|uniref:Activator of HSP90 ATPase n=1 Tax=Myxococcus llanfairpwllgwyngyllgogerychwyrndrobwllllantysiliogogogochensis TaxID=2590453 RepID=A0A540X517_9BACT|nr:MULTISPECIES: SRPBCC domain-containing protein [Myxococcus]NTX03031.1 SRPBCC domain-containing protein [Myxococcus sp. CA040A]TQF16323.1 activator of HSP90 ATPase [Myxococcus llanfairpwllgwyngyllgogerychwyrndrobwllllantysiliogogogochensis]